MGIARTNGRRNNHQQRLAIVAADLEPRRCPYWVSQPDGRHPSQGWWWIAQGVDFPDYLGHNHITAEIALRRTLDGLYKAASA